MPYTIRELREMEGLTQAQLGTIIGVVPSTVYCWETDRTMPSPLSLSRLVAFFRVKADDIILPMVEPGRLRRHPSRATG